MSDGGEPNTAVAATKSGVLATRISDRRSPERDAAAILLAYRHGARAAELTAFCWAQVDLHTGRLHVNRAKGGQEALHPLRGPELRALRRLLPARSYVFVTEQGSPVTTAWFLRMVQRTGPSREACVRRAPAHAAACLRIQAHQRWPRHPIARALPGASQLAEHGTPVRSRGTKKEKEPRSAD
jgi:integrase